MKIPGAVIPDSTNLPDNLYDFKIESFEPGETSTGKFCFNASLRVLAPKAHKGKTHNEMFVIGSNDDPGAREEETWTRFGAVNAKNFAAKAGVKFDGDVETVCKELEGQSVSGRATYTVQPKFNKDGTENPFAGRGQTRVNEWFSIGEKTAGDPQFAGKDKPGVVGKPAAKPVAPPKPDEDDDDEKDAPPAKVKSGKTKPAKPPVEDDDDANVDDDDD